MPGAGVANGLHVGLVLTKGDSFKVNVKDEFVKRLYDLLPNDLFESKDYNSSGLAGRVEWLLAMYKQSKKEIERLERGIDIMTKAIAAKKEQRYDVANGPNLRDGKGNLFLVRCPACRKENYGPNVSSGQCSWRGWEDGDAVAEVDSPPVA